MCGGNGSPLRYPGARGLPRGICEVHPRLGGDRAPPPDGTLLFSGDLGNRHQPIVRDPAPPPKVDVLLIESTYGDRCHRPMDDTVTEFREAIQAVVPENGNLLVPTFALERAQEVLYELSVMWNAGRLPRCRIFLDSPLAISTRRVFALHPGFFDDQGRAIFAATPNPFAFSPLRYTQTTDESREISNASRGNIIPAGSGMCTGGRILHHLRHNLWHERSGVLFVGYQAAGTLGRRIVDGARSVRIFGEEIRVAARARTTNGLSSHADQPILLDWIRGAAPKRLFLVHGEGATLNAFAERIGRNLALGPRIPVSGRRGTSEGSGVAGRLWACRVGGERRSYGRGAIVRRQEHVLGECHRAARANVLAEAAEAALPEIDLGIGLAVGLPLPFGCRDHLDRAVRTDPGAQRAAGAAIQIVGVFTAVSFGDRDRLLWEGDGHRSGEQIAYQLGDHSEGHVDHRSMSAGQMLRLQ